MCVLCDDVSIIAFYTVTYLVHDTYTEQRMIPVAKGRKCEGKTIMCYGFTLSSIRRGCEVILISKAKRKNNL